MFLDFLCAFGMTQGQHLPSSDHLCCRCLEHSVLWFCLYRLSHCMDTVTSQVWIFTYSLPVTPSSTYISADPNAFQVPEYIRFLNLRSFLKLEFLSICLKSLG
jgi:hypothetical protein